MFRRIEDFTAQWDNERKGTLELLRTLTDESLSQEITPGGRTLGFLAWHLTATIPEMLGKAGLKPEGPGEHDPMPSSATAIAAEYERASSSVNPDIRDRWSDDSLAEEVEMYGQKWTRGLALEIFLRHEAHHRGQMTVLMRQAGLPLHGVYGPSREEWIAMGMEPMQ
ncbi:MAG: DinB family protein [Gemmatimonadetes bacterium]|nr:DinB family protein [Gemmatimonadota bacterium]